MILAGMFTRNEDDTRPGAGKLGRFSSEVEEPSNPGASHQRQQGSTSIYGIIIMCQALC